MNPLGVPVLFGKYKKSGYQTMFQEDICWFDRWGIMLTDIERRTEPSNKREFESRYVGVCKTALVRVAVFCVTFRHWFLKIV